MNRSSPRLRSQLRETVRAQILDAAEQLIAAHGLHGSPVVDIAKRAGVAVGTLYNYFTDRDALIKALFESRRISLRPQIAAVVQASENLAFEPRLRALVHGLLSAFDAHRLFIKVAIETEHLKLAPSAAGSDIQTAIDAAVRAGVAEGVLPPERAELASFMLAGALKSVVLRRTAQGSAFVDDAEPMVAMFLDGVRREP